MIYAIGIGLDIKSHITPEAIRVIKDCNKIFILSPDSIALDYVKSLNPLIEIVDCEKFYEHEVNRPKVYEKISKAIINSYQRFTKIGILVYGNPMFLVSAVEKMLLKAEHLDIKTKVIPGISSFDTIISDLKIDLGYGVTLIDASLLLSKKFALEKKLPLLIFQVANLNSEDIEDGRIPLERLTFLVEYLQSIYPRNHLCKFIVSSKSIFELGYIIETRLDEILDNIEVNLCHRPTIYIPEV